MSKRRPDIEDDESGDPTPERSSGFGVWARRLGLFALLGGAGVGAAELHGGHISRGLHYLEEAKIAQKMEPELKKLQGVQEYFISAERRFSRLDEADFRSDPYGVADQFRTASAKLREGQEAARHVRAAGIRFNPLFFEEGVKKLAVASRRLRGPQVESLRKAANCFSRGLLGGAGCRLVGSVWYGVDAHGIIAARDALTDFSEALDGFKGALEGMTDPKVKGYCSNPAIDDELVKRKGPLMTKNASGPSEKKAPETHPEKKKKKRKK